MTLLANFSERTVGLSPLQCQAATGMDDQREQDELERFLDHAAASPELGARLKGRDPYEVVEIAEAEGFHFSTFTLHKAVCTGYVMRRPR